MFRLKLHCRDGRGRGLSIFGTVMFGSLAVGSAIWGQVGGLPAAHILAGLGAMIAVPLLWRWKLQTGAALDLTPSIHALADACPFR
jgi:hypothetical protein